MIDTLNPAGIHPLQGTDLPEWLTRAQLADYLQLSVPTLARWAGERRGPKVTKFGGAARYARADVLSWTSAQSNQEA